MTKLFKLKSKIKLPSEVKMVLAECVIFALGFFLSSVRFIFGIYPFGLAFACATKKYAPFALAGSALGCVFLLKMNILYLIAFGVILGLRLICSLILKKDKKHTLALGKKESPSLLSLLFCENPSVRVAICCFVAFLLSTYTVITNGYLFYDIFVLIFFTIISGVLTLALCGAFDSSTKKTFSLGLITIGFMILYGARELEIFGINPSMVLGCGLVLYISRYLNGAYAGIIGLLLGICFGPSYAPVFGLLGVISGFIWRWSPYLATMCAFAVSMGYGVYAGGYDALVYLAPEMLLSCLVMYTLLRFELLPVPDFIKVKSKSSLDIMLESQKNDARKKMDKLSASLLEISSMLKDVSEKAKLPTKQSYTELCYESVESYCYSCPKRSICWEKDTITTEENLERLRDSSFSTGSVSKLSVSEKFLHRCPHIENIIEKINEESKKILTQGLKNDKLELSSLCYELISKMVEQAIECSEDDEIIDTSLSEKSKRALSRVGAICEDAYVLGANKSKVLILGIDIDRTRCTEAEIKDSLEKSLDLKLCEPRLTTENGYYTMVLERKPVYNAVSFTSSCTAENEKINGDSITSFSDENGISYTILCDGMGSGKEARLTSLLSVTLLEKLLRADVRRELAISMLNGFIRARGEECSSSVDMLQLDLSCGSGRLIKSGAAPSFVKRGDNVFKLQSKTMPVGILKDIYAEELSFEAREGDIIVMLSDGVCSSNDDSDFLIRLLKESSDSEKELPRLIIKEMKKRHDHTDDMTVVCTAIKKEP